MTQPQTFTLVCLESPYAGNLEMNLLYARAAVRDCLNKGESPCASHLLFTQDGILDDTVPEQRVLGIAAGLAWAENAAKTVVYTDLGISQGMHQGIQHAQGHGRPVEYRTLPNWQPPSSSKTQGLSDSMEDKKQQLIDILNNTTGDPETDHLKMDRGLLEYIGDDKITEAYLTNSRWYA